MALHFILLASEHESVLNLLFVFNAISNALRQKFVLRRNSRKVRLLLGNYVRVQTLAEAHLKL